MRTITFKNYVLGVVSAIVMIATPNLARAETIYLTTGTSPVEAPYGQYLTKVFTVAFGKLGYDFQLLDMQSKRASQLVSLGYYDGEATRVYGYGRSFPNMVRVNVQHSDLIFTAYSSDKSLKYTSWQQLSQGDHVVSYRRGAVRPRNMLTKYLPPERVREALNTTLGLKEIADGDVKVYVGLQTKVQTELSNLVGHKFKVYDVGTVERIPCYVYLHAKRKALAPKLEAVLREMKDKGEIAAYFKDIYLKSLL